VESVHWRLYVQKPYSLSNVVTDMIFPMDNISDSRFSTLRHVLCTRLFNFFRAIHKAYTTHCMTMHYKNNGN